jgi:large subunit ribosomal protein L30e
MDVNRALRTATKTGEVRFGISQARKAVEGRQGKLIVLASNCPAKDLREQRAIPVMEFPGNSIELGAACGKPFAVSVATIVSAGESQILSK